MNVISRLFKIVPKNWIARKNHDNEWELKTSLNDSQPLEVFVQRFDYNVDYSRKLGYQATFGVFAGSSITIAPLRKTLKETKRDCFLFMKAFRNTNKDELEKIIWTIGFIQNRYSSEYCYKNPCSECSFYDNCVLSPFVFKILDLNQVF